MGGGAGNIAGGSYATASGGYSNIAAGDFSFAAGARANAAGDGAVEVGHRQAQHVGVDRLPQALHRAHREAGQADELGVAQNRRRGAGRHVAADQ